MDCEDYCLAVVGQNTDEYCQKYKKNLCEGCPFFDEGQLDMDEYDERCNE